MDHRGRKSTAELSVITGDGIVSVSRPEPPSELTDEQAIEWRAVVNRLPSDWFPRETHGLLVQYCRHLVNSRRVAEMIEQTRSKAVDITMFDRLLKMQEREVRAIASLASRMRITQQSTVSKDKSKPGPKASKPWEAK